MTWGKPKNSEKNLSPCDFVHHKSHKGWLGTKRGLRDQKAVANSLSDNVALWKS